MRQQDNSRADAQAAIQRRLSTSSLRKIFAAMVLVTTVSDAEAGATRLKSAWLSANNREKKLTAIAVTPQKKRALVITALMAPMSPEWALISSRSPIWRMADAISTSPVVAPTIMLAMLAALASPVW